MAYHVAIGRCPIGTGGSPSARNGAITGVLSGRPSDAEADRTPRMDCRRPTTSAMKRERRASSGYLAGGREITHGQRVGGIEAGVHGLQAAEAFEKQAGADEEHDGKRHLPGHQQAARAVTARAAGGSPAAIADHAIKVGARDLKRGDEAEENSREQGDGERESEDLKVDANRLKARQADAAGAREQGDAPPGEQDTEAAPAADSTRLSARIGG